MTEVMMALGDYRFSLDTAAYQKLQRSHSYRWSSQERLGRRPARQYMGPGEESIDLDGIIYPTFKGGLGQLEDMREQAGRGEPLTLVDGLGEVWGTYCIEEIQETRRVFLANGAPRKIEFSLKIARYGDDDLQD